MDQVACDICDDPTDGYVCRRCTDETGRYLQGAELSGEVETTVALQARYAVRGGTSSPEPVPEDAPTALRPSQRAETFAWAASREQPTRGALRATRLPVDLNASARAARAFNRITTWARAVNDDRGGELPEPRRGQHHAAAAAAYLLDQLDWIRHQQFAGEAFQELRAAGADIRRIVDSPPEQQIVGRCDCQAYLYARKGAGSVTCSDCNLRWDVATSRQNLWDALPGYLMTASEAALLLMLHGIGNQDRRRWAKTITMWGQRSLISEHGEIDGAPTYLFGDILNRATRQEQQPKIAS